VAHFIISITYKKSLQEVDKFINEHVKFLNKYYDLNNFILSGRKNPRTGGIILCKFDAKENVQEAIKEDPFYKNELADYEIIEFVPTKKLDAISELDIFQ